MEEKGISWLKRWFLCKQAIGGKPGAWEGRVKGSADPPPRFGAYVQKLHMALMSDRCQSNINGHLSTFLPPYVALTIVTISRGGVKINASCYMIKLDFWPWIPCWKMAPARLEKTYVSPSYSKNLGYAPGPPDRRLWTRPHAWCRLQFIACQSFVWPFRMTISIDNSNAASWTTTFPGSRQNSNTGPVACN